MDFRPPEARNGSKRHAAKGRASMNDPLVLAGIVLVGVVDALLPVAGDAHFRSRRRGRGRGPETDTGADAQLDARSVTPADPAVRVAGGSLWPGGGGRTSP
jgi:hypothetical protein